MKNIFLLAKYIAIENNSEKIELEHFKKALASVEILDEKAKKILDTIEKTNNSNIFYNEENIETALKAQRKDFSDEVDQLKTILEEKGFTLSKTISKLAFEKSVSDVLKNIRNIKKELSEILYEQDMAIESITDSLIRSEYIENQDKVKSVFFFTGDVGSGKSFAAKTFADLMSNQEYEFKIFNMGSYTSDNESFVLNGLSRGYSGAKEGELTSFVKKHPKSIILFDSIEKAHNNVVNTLNEILDYGTMVDNYTTQKIDFSNTILIFETNAGKEVFLKPDFQKILQKDSFASESMLLESISKELEPGYKDLFILPREFLGRLVDASTIIFNKLTFNSCVEILKKQLIQEQTQLEKKFNIEIEFTNFDSIVKLLVLSSGPDYSIRKILKKAPFSIFDPITDYLLSNEINLKTIYIKYDTNFDKILEELLQEQQDNKLLHNLFRKNKTGNFKIDIQDNETSIIVLLDQFKFETVKKVSDFGGDTGLIIEVPDSGFEKIAGHEKVKSRLSEIIDILKNKELNEKYAEFVSKGMLLYGPPGTGKTMLARAFAKEADLPFIATTGPDLLNEKTIKDVFTKARQYAPAIVFIDEIDVFKHRGLGYGTDVLINKLLTEIDGFSNSDQNRIFIIAATNLKEQIDSAILRSGRIDLHVEVNALDKKARGFFIAQILKNSKFDDSINSEKIIKMTSGFSGADLKKLERELILDAYRKGIEIIDERIFIEHINIIKYGEIIENNKSIEETLEQTAYHEAGHAVISKTLFPNKDIEQITIVPRIQSLGFVSYEFKEDVQYDLNELKNMICVSLAGRIAESKKFEITGINSGASNDLEKATQLAYTISAQYGMYDNINITVFQKSHPEYFKEKIETEIKSLIDEMTKKTTKLIDENWKKIEKLASLLLAKETVYKEDITI